MQNSQVAEIVEFIEQKCLSADEVLGTEIGTAIKVRFPEINLRVDFGGLRAFVKDHCVDKIVYVRPKGGDGVYAHISKLGAAPPQDPRPVATPQTSRNASAWAALVDPNVAMQLAADPTSGVLQVFAVGQTIPEVLFHVQKISVEEHRTIAQNFVETIPESSRRPFEDALKEKVFWSKWTTAFQGLPDRSIYVNWMKWRHDQILAMFQERLRSGQFSDTSISTALAELKKSKQIKEAVARPESPSTSRTSAQIPSARFIKEPSQPAVTQLHALAHSALDLMSEAEVRRIWLPLGAVADACRRHS